MTDKLVQLFNEGLKLYPRGMQGLARHGAIGEENDPDASLYEDPYSDSYSGEAGKARAARETPKRGLSAVQLPPVATTAQRGKVWGGGGIGRADATTQFATWLQKFHPQLYAASVKHTGKVIDRAQMSGIGQSTDTPAAKPWYEQLLDTVKALAPTYLQSKAQSQLLQVQIDRASKGLPPLNPSQIAPAVQLSVDPSQASYVLQQAKPWLIGGALVLGALFVFNAMKGRRR